MPGASLYCVVNTPHRYFKFFVLERRTAKGRGEEIDRGLSAAGVDYFCLRFDELGDANDADNKGIVSMVGDGIARLSSVRG